MKHLEDWMNLLCKEIDREYENGNYEKGNEMTEQAAKRIDMLAHAAKCLGAYSEMLEREDRSRSVGPGEYYYGGDDYSRESRGREYGRSYGRDGYSNRAYPRGYSRHNEPMDEERQRNLIRMIMDEMNGK